MESKKIMGVRVDFGMSMDDVVDTIETKLMRDGKNHLVCTTNPEFIIDAQNDEEFKEIINKELENYNLQVTDFIKLPEMYLEMRGETAPEAIGEADEDAETAPEGKKRGRKPNK